MSGRGRALVRQGLGDSKTCILGILLIAIGAIGTLVLRNLANIETVFVVALLAGSVLGRWWTVLVPMGTLLVLEPVLWGTDCPGCAGWVVLGRTCFIGELGRELEGDLAAKSFVGRFKGALVDGAQQALLRFQVLQW